MQKFSIEKRRPLTIQALQSGQTAQFKTHLPVLVGVIECLISLPTNRLPDIAQELYHVCSGHLGNQAV
jgi:hypothetical protein